MEFRCIISLLFSAYALIHSIVSGQSKDEVFHVQPGAGSQTFESKVGDHVCSFTYAAQGGTNEEWAISFEIQDNGSKALCTVERRIPSYIYFEHFSLKLQGQDLSIADSEVLSAQAGFKHLAGEEYTLDENSISSVAGKFKNKLEKVAVLSTSGRQEL